MTKASRNGFGITLGKNNTTGFYRVTGIFYRYFYFVRLGLKTKKAVKAMTAKMQDVLSNNR